MTTEEFPACFEEFENTTITLNENSTYTWISSLEGALQSFMLEVIHIIISTTLLWLICLLFLCNC
jgi:hypothetical protein